MRLHYEDTPEGRKEFNRFVESATMDFTLLSAQAANLHWGALKRAAQNPDLPKDLRKACYDLFMAMLLFKSSVNKHSSHLPYLKPVAGKR